MKTLIFAAFLQTYCLHFTFGQAIEVFSLIDTSYLSLSQNQSNFFNSQRFDTEFLGYECLSVA